MARKNKAGKPGYYTYHEVVDSLAYRSLPAGAKALYHDLRKKYRGYNNGNISATLSDLKPDGYRSSATLSKHLSELQEHGLIVKTRQGGLEFGAMKNCSLYAFTDLPIAANDKLRIQGREAPHDYRKYTPPNLDRKEQKNVSLQKVNRSASNSEPHRFKIRFNKRAISSENESGSKEDIISKTPSGADLRRIRPAGRLVFKK